MSPLRFAPSRPLPPRCPDPSRPRPRRRASARVPDRRDPAAAPAASGRASQVRQPPCSVGANARRPSVLHARRLSSASGIRHTHTHTHTSFGRGGGRIRAEPRSRSTHHFKNSRSRRRKTRAAPHFEPPKLTEPGGGVPGAAEEGAGAGAGAGAGSYVRMPRRWGTKRPARCRTRCGCRPAGTFASCAPGAAPKASARRYRVGQEAGGVGGERAGGGGGKKHRMYPSSPHDAPHEFLTSQ